MNKEILKEALKQSTLQILVLIVMTFVGLVGITYILDPKSVSAFFH